MKEAHSNSQWKQCTIPKQCVLLLRENDIHIQSENHIRLINYDASRMVRNGEVFYPSWRGSCSMLRHTVYSEYTQMRQNYDPSRMDRNGEVFYPASRGSCLRCYGVSSALRLRVTNQDTLGRYMHTEGTFRYIIHVWRAFIGYAGWSVDTLKIG